RDDVPRAADDGGGARLPRNHYPANPVLAVGHAARDARPSRRERVPAGATCAAGRDAGPRRASRVGADHRQPGGGRRCRGRRRLVGAARRAAPVTDAASDGEAWVWAALAAVAVSLVFATHDRYGGWNDSSRLGMVEAIVEHGRLWVDGTTMGRKSGDVCMIDGHYYSDKPPTPALMAVPVYWAETRLGITFHAAEPRAYYWTTLVTIGLSTWLGLVALARFLRRFVPDPRWRALTVLGLGLGSLNTVYS